MNTTDPERIVRKGFGLRKQVAEALAQDYESSLVSRARRSGYRLSWPGFVIRIAEEFGFCYGVERAVDYAYETRQHFPDRRLFITGEIIHNPGVNVRLRELGYEFLDGKHGSSHTIEDLTAKDVVLIPAFGVTMEFLEQLRGTGALLVDTTCGSVLNVWKNVERFAREGFTCVIHGKWAHEETQATASRALRYSEGRVLVLRDIDQAELVARYIREGGDKEEFYRRFQNAFSRGFDPDSDLGHIGMANQTTMLSSESLRIAGLIRDALAGKFGERALAERFRSFDTICSATEDRQQAVIRMMRTPPQLMIVIGGYNSSNTGHLAEICAEDVPTYHVESATELLSPTEIRHKPISQEELVISRSWLPEGDVEIGITAGASTPDRGIGEVIARLLKMKGLAS